MSKFPALERAVSRLIEAEVNHSWMGAQNPVDHLAIQQELDNARSNYKYQLERIQAPAVE